MNIAETAERKSYKPKTTEEALAYKLLNYAGCPPNGMYCIDCKTEKCVKCWIDFVKKELKNEI